MEKKFTLGLIVSNHFGVLNRVAALYSKRGYNIDSLAVGETENPHFSRMTIVSKGDEYKKRQVVSQLKKLYDVKMVVVLEEENSVSVEHMLIKMRADGNGNKKISDLINAYGGKVMDFSEEQVTAEITGDSDKIDRFVKSAAEIGILEVCRSGTISLSRGINQ